MCDGCLRHGLVSASNGRKSLPDAFLDIPYEFIYFGFGQLESGSKLLDSAAVKSVVLLPLTEERQSVRIRHQLMSARRTVLLNGRVSLACPRAAGLRRVTTGCVPHVDAETEKFFGIPLLRKLLLLRGLVANREEHA